MTTLASDFESAVTKKHVSHWHRLLWVHDISVAPTSRHRDLAFQVS